MTPAEKTRLVKTLAVGLGFDQVGIARTVPSPWKTYYRQWLARGHAGSMRYLHGNAELRENPARLLPGARSAICVALSYWRGASLASRPGSRPVGRVAQYVRGADYHRVLRAMLQELLARLRERLEEPFGQRVFVDTGPVLERELAAAAGLGWIGKNTMLVHERLGSYLFLGEIVTTLELEPDAPVTDHCGNCTRCLEACPPRALPKPYQLDASRCISYFTIEHRGEVPAEFHEPIGNWVYGCDVCQQVCPFNRHAPAGTHPELTADRIPEYLPLLDLLWLRSSEYRRLTNGTAARRARRNMWRRNATIALGNAENIGEPEKRALADACDDEDPTVRHAAQHAARRRRS
ncbi:MAG: tRNA epoxyqueuosine(34) reductase QueG [Phycisphaerae bacterium]